MQELGDVSAAFAAKFDQVYIDRAESASALARRVCEIFPAEKIVWVDELPSNGGELSPQEFARSKRLLHLTRFKGKFFKRCPGSRPGLSCCNYFVLNWGLQCDMNCSYCYLQSFINTPRLTLYTNIEDALIELKEMASGDWGRQSVRIGTGETVDSLSLDRLTLHSRRLIEFFKDMPQWTLEFKTKSDQVDQFLDVAHAGNVIVSWSVNPQNIVAAEEHATAALSDRFAAAERCLRHGYKVSFHIDPMIWHPEWRENYAMLIDEIHHRFTPDQVPYMSVGALRFQPEQRAMMRERFGMKSYVTQAETYRGPDGKLRYDARLRQEMFQFVLERFRSLHPDWRLFLCMETPETWLKAAGQSPYRDPRLHDLFDPAVLRHP
jgi:spore photoproduct lyase